jgi:four helix bundle protein
MQKVLSYRELDTWKVAITVVEQTYGLSAGFPPSERYGLCAQMRRASVSIPSNVAEGQSRRSPRGRVSFLNIALGSSAELDTQLELARRLRFVPEETTRELQVSIDRVRQLLYGMRREQERRLRVPLGVLLGVLLVAARLLA